MKIKRDLTRESWGSELETSPYPKQIATLLSENVIFNFPDGIPAFETAKSFIILLNERIKPFIYLKSLDIEDLGFVCVDPFLVCSNYSIQIPAKDLSVLGLKDPASALIFCLVTVDSDPQKTTCNLLAPIIINMDNNIGRQVILEDSYPVRHRIWEGLEALEKRSGRA
jgi:flagellar assembly factor FliW